MRKTIKMHSLLSAEEKRSMYYVSRIPKSDKSSKFRRLFIASPSLAKTHSRFYAIHKKLIGKRLIEPATLLTRNIATIHGNYVMSYPLLALHTEAGEEITIASRNYCPNRERARLLYPVKDLKVQLEHIKTMLELLTNKHDPIDLEFLDSQLPQNKIVIVNGEKQGLRDAIRQDCNKAKIRESMIGLLRKKKQGIDELLEVINTSDKLSEKTVLTIPSEIAARYQHIGTVPFTLSRSSSGADKNVTKVALTLEEAPPDLELGINQYKDFIRDREAVRGWYTMQSVGVIGGRPGHHLVEILEKAYDAEAIFKSDISGFFRNTNKRVIKKALNYAIKKALLAGLASGMFVYKNNDAGCMITTTPDTLTFNKALVPEEVELSSIGKKILNHMGRCTHYASLYGLLWNTNKRPSWRVDTEGVAPLTDLLPSLASEVEVPPCPTDSDGRGRSVYRQYERNSKYRYGRSRLMPAYEQRSISDNVLLNLTIPLTPATSIEERDIIFKTITRDVANSEFGLISYKDVKRSLPEKLKQNYTIMAAISRFLYVYNRQAVRMVGLVYDIPAVEVPTDNSLPITFMTSSSSLSHRDYDGPLLQEDTEKGSIFVSTSRLGRDVTKIMTGDKNLEVLCINNIDTDPMLIGCLEVENVAPRKTEPVVAQRELKRHFDEKGWTDTLSHIKDNAAKLEQGLKSDEDLGARGSHRGLAAAYNSTVFVVSDVSQGTKKLKTYSEEYVYKKKTVTSQVDMEEFKVVIDTGAHRKLDVKDTLNSMLYRLASAIAEINLPAYYMEEVLGGNYNSLIEKDMLVVESMMHMTDITSNEGILTKYADYTKPDLDTIFCRSFGAIPIMSLVYDKTHDVVKTAVVLPVDYWLALTTIKDESARPEDADAASRVIELLDGAAIDACGKLRSMLARLGETAATETMSEEIRKTLHFADYIVCVTPDGGVIAKVPDELRHDMKLDLRELAFTELRSAKSNKPEYEVLSEELNLGIDYKVDLLTTAAGVLPEGGIVSPVLANYVMSMVCDELRPEVESFGGVIQTYMDDITISFMRKPTKKQLKRTRMLLEKSLTGLGLSISKDKTKVIDGTIKRELLGGTVLKYNGPRPKVTIRLPRGKKRLLAAKIFNLKKFLAAYNTYLDVNKSLKPTEEFIRANYPKGFDKNSHFKVPRLINRLRGELAWALSLSRARYQEMQDDFDRNCVAFFKQTIIPKIKEHSLGFVDMSKGMTKDYLDEIDEIIT